MDVEYEILRIEKALTSIETTFQWVKGHQDIKKSKNPRYTELNDMVDKLATETREKVLIGEYTRQQLDIFPSSIASLQIENELVHNSIKDAIKLKMCERRINKYMLEKFD